MNISEDFTRRVADDRLCAAVRQAVEEGNTAALERLGMRGFGRYAGRLAELIEESVRLGVDPDDLGFETLINELASPARYAHHLVNESGTAIQTALDSRNGLRIKPAEPEFESGRLGAIVSEAAHSDSDNAADNLATQIGTMTKDAGNRFMEANAEQRDRAGFKVTVRRTGGADCCPWCSARTGSWELKNAPDGVFGCHDNCKCMVDYTNSAGTVRGKAIGRKWDFAEVPYEPPHVMSREEAREKGGFDEPKRLTGGANGGIINEKSNKPVIAITDNAIQNVRYVSVHGYTEEQNKIIQQQHKELLKIARDKNDNFEVAIVLNHELQPNAPIFGRDNDVTFGMLNGTNLTILHNHPRGSSFSANDLEFFCKCGQVKTLTIVKNNGQVEYITKSDSFNPNTLSLEYARLHKKMIKKGTSDEYDKLIKKLLTVTKSGVIWNE